MFILGIGKRAIGYFPARAIIYVSEHIPKVCERYNLEHSYVKLLVILVE